MTMAMTMTMTIAELKPIVGRRPFRPFSLLMADGRELPVRHPNQLGWRGDDAWEIAYVSSGKDGEILDLSSILSIRWLPSSWTDGDGEEEKQP
jgi:hypothetical protein